MGCCGGKRELINLGHKPEEQEDPVYFQYTGRTGLTIIGRETRTRYRFDNPGSVVAVDIRDKDAMIYVPNLRQMK